MNGSKGTAPISSFSPLILDPSLNDARAAVESARINKSAIIRAAEISAGGVTKTANATVKAAELALKGAKYRNLTTIAVAVIGLGSLIWADKDTKRKLHKAEDHLDAAIAENNEWEKTVHGIKREKAIATGHVGEFMRCSEHKNPFVLYPCLQLARSRVESDSVPPKPQQLA
jgi:hypothetical protein